uniref:Uncharacterized protein n=1 Tax=Hyaloperonospora arabidopsidis (strain Emoy2) TaxID=559515 RepID=M4C5L1_HYAAE
MSLFHWTSSKWQKSSTDSCGNPQASDEAVISAESRQSQASERQQAQAQRLSPERGTRGAQDGGEVRRRRETKRRSKRREERRRRRRRRRRGERRSCTNAVELSILHVSQRGVTLFLRDVRDAEPLSICGYCWSIQRHCYRLGMEMCGLYGRESSSYAGLCRLWDAEPAACTVFRS